MEEMTLEMTLRARAIEVSDNMRELHRDFRSGAMKREDADTVANINGKNLKALAIVIADRMCERAYLDADMKALRLTVEK